MVVVKLIVIVLVLLFRLSVVDSDASSSVIQRLIVRLEDPSSDNGTLFKQIEVRFFLNLISIFPGIPVCFG